jgi:hypothetical protein
MQILCEVNQAECFRRGIDAPKSTIKLEVNPVKLPEDLRAFVADHLYDGYKLRLEGGIPGSDLLAFMEAILANQEFRKADPNGWWSDFNSWIRGDGKESAGERLEKAKQLAEAQQEELRNQYPSGHFDPERYRKDMEGTVKMFSEASKVEQSKIDKEAREKRYGERMNEREEEKNAALKLSIEKTFGSKK